MKKLFFFGALFAVGLGFTACSSDKDEVAEGTNPIENNGKNFIAISINMPTANSNGGINNAPAITRATDNGGNIADLNDGMDSEYAVKDASLLIFNSAGSFREAWVIDPKPWAYSSDPHVTKVSTKVVQPVTGNVAVGDKMLVILNNNGLISINETSHTLQIMKNGTLTDFTGTFESLTEEANEYFASTTGLDCGKMNEAGFYMANAVLTDKTTAATADEMNAATEQILVSVSAIYTSETEAAGGTADQIYVERGMAKVTMEQSVTTPTLSISKVDGSTSLTGTVTGWTLDNCNPNSFLVRKGGLATFKALKSNSTVTGAAVYRYFGTAAITEGSPTTYKYRTYFAESANYAKGTALNRIIAPVYFTQEEIDAATSGDPAYGKTNNDIKTPGTAFSTDFGDTNPQYCFENTFSVNDQNVDKTTLVQVEIQAAPSGGAVDLYTLNGNKSTIYNLTNIKTQIANAVVSYLKDNKATYVNTGSEGSLSSSEITVTLSNEIVGEGAGAVTVTKLTPNGTTKASLKSDALNGADLVAAIVSDINTDYKIVKYASGKSYYNIRIKHYGDLLTPWKNGETNQPTVGNIYPSETNRDGNYLGRYGVLRNNWYVLKVNTIKTLGEATPHTDNWPSTPDDELDNYITFQINVLSWAKHVTQNADL